MAKKSERRLYWVGLIRLTQWRQREFKVGGTKFPKGWGCGVRVPHLQKIFCFVNSKWHILANSEVLKLKYVIILGKIFQLMSSQPKYWGMCPRHPRRGWRQWSDFRWLFDWERQINYLAIQGRWSNSTLILLTCVIMCCGQCANDVRAGVLLCFSGWYACRSISVGSYPVFFTSYSGDFRRIAEHIVEIRLADRETRSGKE